MTERVRPFGPSDHPARRDLVAVDFETYYDNDTDIATLGSYGYINHPKANAYLVDLQKRRHEELNNYAMLTGQDAALHSGYASEYNRYIRKNTGTTGKKTGSLLLPGTTDGNGILITFLSVLSITLMLFALSRKNKPKNSA